MNEKEEAALRDELNDCCTRHGRYLATWLELFPEDNILSPPEPEALVRRYRALLEVQREAGELRCMLDRRRAQMDRDEVQAVLWVGQWRIWRTAAIGGTVRWLLRGARRLLSRPARSITAPAGPARPPG